MSELDVVQDTPDPRTKDTLVQDLRRLGVRAGMTLLVHSSLRSLGWVCGGSVAVVQALQEAVTSEGTLVMPTHTSNYSDPAQWHHPGVPDAWKKVIYASMPAFDPRVTPSWFMGTIVETFRTGPDVLRSNHPQVSFAAWGRQAPQITAHHGLTYGLGERSPLARIYDLEGYVLLLGVGYNSNTSFHLAEYRCPGQRQIMQGAPILEGGQRVWKQFNDIEIDADIFPAIGYEFELTGHVTTGYVGSAFSRFFPQRTAVDFAVRWFTNQRETS